MWATSGKKYKTWITKHDKKFRYDHQEVDGIKLPIKEPFDVGGSLLMFPTDMSLDAHLKQICNCRCQCTYDGEDEDTEDSLKESENDVIISGTRILDPNSDEAEAFGKMYYPEIRKMVFDVDKIAKNTGFSKSDVLKVKKYLFLDESYYDESLGKWVRFPSDGAIAQSWQRMKDQKPKPHDITLLKHELEEMKIKEDNPGISHTKAHELAQEKYNYQKEADEYYGSLRKLSEK